MSEASLPKPLLRGAALLLSAAYLIILCHITFQEKPDSFQLVWSTVKFVPPIISAVSLLIYSSSLKKKYLVSGIIGTIICAITCAFDVYLIIVAIDSIMVDFDTSFYGLLYWLPAIYAVLLLIILLAEKEH